jgi:LPS sulfotransferase NodH
VDLGALQAYLVCANPRGGGTLLCEILRHSSLPRQPREYFGDLEPDVEDLVSAAA